MKGKLYRFIVVAVLTLALLIPSFGDTVAASPPDGPPGLQRAIEAQEAHTDRLLNIPGVVGTAVGFGDDSLPAVKIYTEEVGVAGLPKSLDGVPVEVVVTGRFYARDDPKDRHRPAPIGVSTGHPDITAGTIGARVKDNDGPNVYALSNNHVYANSNEASIGDSALQPGPYDGGTDPEDKIGELSDFELINFDGSDNIMDAAIAVSSTDLLGNATLPDGYGVPGADPVSASIEQDVQKYGRTTGLTQGKVSEINVIVNVCYDARGVRCFKSARFVGQIAITPGSFSDGGDSGSLIVTNDANKSPVGLLFAGSSTRTLANPIGPVLARFKVTIDSEPIDTPPSVSIVSPAEGSIVSGTASVQINATDTEDAAGMLTVEWNVDGGPWIPTSYDSDTGYYEASWDTNGAADGSHTVNARAIDGASNEATDSNSVLVDNIDDPPTANIVNPADGSTVSGVVTIQVDSSDDRDAAVALSVKVSIDAGPWQEATYNNTVGYYELDWNTRLLLDGSSHTIDARSTDSALQTTVAKQVSVTVNNSVSTMHVGDLDGQGVKLQRGNWKAEVTITVHDANHDLVPYATVTGNFYQNGDIVGPISWITDESGTCTINSGQLPSKGGQVTFVVDSVTHDTLSYDPAANHDPDGDSNGTTIIVSK